MKLPEKKQYIEEVRARIEDAPNHGNNGSSWWYPTPWTVAYNVKIHCITKSIEDIRAKMSPVQNKYYSDEMLYNLYYELLERECEELQQTLSGMQLVENVTFAGRSGGWCEVTYTSFEDTSYTDGWTMKDWDSLYNEAVALNKAEQEVKKTIEDTHKALCTYLNSDIYVEDCVESLRTDSEIIEEKQSIVNDYINLQK